MYSNLKFTVGDIEIELKISSKFYFSLSASGMVDIVPVKLVFKWRKIFLLFRGKILKDKTKFFTVNHVRRPRRRRRVVKRCALLPPLGWATATECGGRDKWAPPSSSSSSSSWCRVEVHRRSSR